jgi:hypothetical protein
LESRLAISVSIHGRLVLPIALLLLIVFSAASVQRASAVTTITAYQAQTPVTINGVVSPGEWSDAQIYNITVADMGVAFKHNSTGLLFLMQWQSPSSVCSDQACFGGIELGFTNNTQVMGSLSTPTIMVLASPSFTGGVDEFISKSEATPVTVESDGYKTQSTCALKLSGTTYTAECYRPFALSNASPYDPFLSLAAGSPIEIGFAVGEFTSPGLHDASDMSTYVLTLSSQTYTATSSSSESSTSQTSQTSQTSSTSGQTVTTSTATTSGPSAATYTEELLVIVLGFSVLALAVVLRYKRS